MLSLHSCWLLTDLKTFPRLDTLFRGPIFVYIHMVSFLLFIHYCATLFTYLCYILIHTYTPALAVIPILSSSDPLLGRLHYVWCAMSLTLDPLLVWLSQPAVALTTTPCNKGVGSHWCLQHRVLPITEWTLEQVNAVMCCNLSGCRSRGYMYCTWCTPV